MNTEQPNIQLIANLVIHNNQDVVLVRYDPENQAWWLPGGDLEPFEHPDEAAKRILSTFAGLEFQVPKLASVESFRGRRGWHIVFHYDVPATGQPANDVPTQWFGFEEFPQTVHGKWERDSVLTVLHSK
jgi:ADP-ribose pyrophosphatase YjhB (NUDIX family)